MIKLELSIGVNGEDKSEKAFKGAEKNAANLAEKLTALSEVYREFGKKALEAMSEPIKAAMENERVNNLLGNSLKSMNIYTEESYTELQKWAEELEGASGKSAELIKQLTAQNIQLGLSATQAQAMTQAAMGLAAATGKDLPEANALLVASLSGHAMMLEKLVPGVRGLTEAQLKHGAAIDLVGAKYTSFINSNLATTDGALKRIKQSFENTFKDLGTKLLEGLDLPGNFGVINEALEKFGHAIEHAGPEIQAFGTKVMAKAVEGIEFLAEHVDVVIKAFELLFTVIEKGAQVFNMLATLIDMAVIGIQQIADGIGGLAKIFISLHTFQLSQAKEQWDELAKSQAGYTAAGEAATKQLGKEAAALLGLNEAQKKAQEEYAKSQKDDAKKPPGVSQIKAGKVNLGMSEADLQAQRAMQEQLNQQTVALQFEQGIQVAGEYTQRLLKINEMEKLAAAKGYNIAAQSQALKDALLKSYTDKIEEAVNQQTLDMAKAAGNTTLAIDLEYQKQLRDFNKLKDNQLISEEQYQDAVEEARRKKNEAQRQTSGTAAGDEALGKVNQIMSSAQSGLNAIIGTIGHFFGPIGEIIAGIIQFFNQTPEMFQKMWSGLIKGIPTMFKNIFANMGYVIESFPILLADMLRQVFSIPFWEKIVVNLYHALLNMFQNFWAELFGGKLKQDTVIAQAKQPKPAQFGNSDPNAGNGEFKIKDANLADQRKAKSFTDEFQGVVSTSGKSLVDMLKEAWQHIIDMLDAWLHKFIDAMLELWRFLYNTFAQPIIDGLLWVWRFVYDNFIGPTIAGLKYIWEYAYNLLMGAWNVIKGIFDQVVGGFYAAFDWIKHVFGDIIGAFSGTFGWIRDIFSGFIDALKPIADAFKSVSGGGGGGGGYLTQQYHAITGFARGGDVVQNSGDRALAAVWAAMGVRRAAGGEDVVSGGIGAMDVVPRLVRNGEKILTPEQAKSRGSDVQQNVSITFNVAAGANFDKAAVQAAMPQIITLLKRESSKGANILRPAGVY